MDKVCGVSRTAVVYECVSLLVVHVTVGIHVTLASFPGCILGTRLV